MSAYENLCVRDEHAIKQLPLCKARGFQIKPTLCLDYFKAYITSRSKQCLLFQFKRAERLEQISPFVKKTKTKNIQTNKNLMDEQFDLSE